MKLLAAALALVALAGSARAQTSVAPRAPLTFAAAENPSVASGNAEWTLRVSPRLVAALGSPSAAVRAEALHAVGSLAVTSEGADLRPAIPALLDVFRTDPDWRLRVMALRSLEASADEGAMAALRNEVGRPAPPAVQRLLVWVLVGHYGVDAARRDADLMDLARLVRDSDRKGYRDRGPQSRLVAAR